jgi:hypothetical protein
LALQPQQYPTQPVFLFVLVFVFKSEMR